jgi:hypothetical protein
MARIEHKRKQAAVLAASLLAGSASGWGGASTAGAAASTPATGTTHLVSVPLHPGGNAVGRDASVSATGRFVAFMSPSPDLVPDGSNVGDVFVRDVVAHRTWQVSLGENGAPANLGAGNAAITPDGRFVAFASQSTNLVAADPYSDADVFVRDRATRVTRLYRSG